MTGKYLRQNLLAAFAISTLLVSGRLMFAQQRPMERAEAQRSAMRKLAFLVGQWTGPVTIFEGPTPRHLTQSENVRYELGGLVILIQGKSVGSDGKPQFQALATVAYDEGTHTYRIRAYNNGHYVDAPMTVSAQGFSWGFAAGPAHIVNTMGLTSRGQWQEKTEVTVGSRRAFRSVDMLLTRGQ